jgi:hypothetical protein
MGWEAKRSRSSRKTGILYGMGGQVGRREGRWGGRELKGVYDECRYPARHLLC